MSETGTSVVRRRGGGGGGGGSSSEPFVLPQWVVEIIRPCGRVVSKLLWRINYIGTENIPPTGGLIIAANHQSYVDPFWVTFPVRRPLRYLAWNEAFKWPIVGKFMYMFGAWPLQLEGSDPSAIRRTLQWLRGGGAVMIFPEGARSLPDGEMLKFKNGAARIALEAGVPILPVTIRGANRVWPRGYRLPHLARVEIIFHPPYTVELQEGEDARHAARRATGHLAELIGSALSG